jgi:hypothetical protein
MSRIARRIGLGDEAAEGLAEHDRPLDAERITEGPDILAPLCQRPAVGRTGITAPHAAVIEIDNLDQVGERAEGWLEGGMIKAGPAMQQQ